jgi:hypothetical protein
MIDMFKTHARSLTSPPEDAASITPGDAGSELSHVTRALYVGVSGDLALLMQGGATVVLRGVPSGSFLPLRVRQVLAAGTSADGIVGFW